MSALEDEPGDFLDWCHARGLSADPGDYLPRRLYGAYLRDLLARFDDGRLELVRSRVQNVVESLFHGEVRLALRDGRVLRADAAVLALGNPPPSPLAGVPAASTPALVSDPWAPGAMRHIAAHRRIAVIGTGLTAVDIAFSVAAANPEATVTAISRHGWLPRAHGPATPAPRALKLEPGCTLEEILAEVAAALAARPAAWRGVVDALRPHTPGLWQGLTGSERERFDRELRAWWDVHRHRLSPSSSGRVAELQRSGRLVVHGGGICSVGPRRSGGVRLELGSGGRVDAEVLVNATGPSKVTRAPVGTLTCRMLASGRACPDALGIGFATSPEGALIDIEGVASRRCFTLGPPRRGELLESTAIPEIRKQAAELASVLLEPRRAHAHDLSAGELEPAD
jgi:uncharacterized NAD(P)/FAD-binding protein YdhS